MRKEKRFLSKDGKTRLHAVIWLPDRGEVKAVLQLIHGMSEYILRYDEFATCLAREGYLVVGHDHLGHGGSVDRQDEKGYFAEDPLKTLLADIHQLRVNVTGRYPHVPYFMLGHSMGSFLLRCYLSIFGEDLAGAIIMGTGYSLPQMAGFGEAITRAMARLKGWHHRSLLVQGLTYNGSYRSYDITGGSAERSWLTKDRKIASAYINDPMCGFLFTLNGHRGLFQAVGQACLTETVRTYPKSLPLLLVSGELDPVGGLGKGVRKVYDTLLQAGLADVSLKLYPGDRHEILNETDRETVIEDLLKWLEEKRKANNSNPEWQRLL